MNHPAPEETPLHDEQMPDRPSGLRPTSRAPLIALGLAALVAGALGVWFWRRPAPKPPPAAAPVAAPAPAPAPAQPPASPAADAGGARALLELVSAHPLFRRCLGEDDPLRRWAVVTDNLAQGTGPSKALACLAPGRPFSVAVRGGRTVIAAESYQRYDDFAAAIASVDAQALARAYRELHPALEAAYRGLGYPEGSLDRAAARALRRIRSVPARDGDVALVEAKGTIYEFADPRLESLGEIEKHLLRMGPRNTRIIQAKARDLEQALGLPPDTARAR